MTQRLTPWQLILVYFASDACINVAARSFQIYCTWYLVSVMSREDQLSTVMILVWTTSTVFLPFAGVLAEAYRKSRLLMIGASAALASSLGLWLVVSVADHEAWPFAGVLLLAVVASVSTALTAPLNAPLVPMIVKEEAGIHRAMSVRSSMFVINLILGPTLAGFLIGVFGGTAAIWLGSVAGLLGLGLSIFFASKLGEPRNAHQRRIGLHYITRELSLGIMRVASIPAERAIGFASLLANLILVPLLFLLLPAKMLGIGMTMLELAFAELSFGVGILFASAILIARLRRRLSEHSTASLGVASMGLAMVLLGCFDHVLVLCFSAFMLGCALTAFNVTVNAKRAVAIPDGFRATMEATLRFFCVLAVPLGFWLSSQAIAVMGPSRALVYSSTLLFIAALCVCFSGALKAMLNSPKGDVPFYIRQHANLFKEVGQ